MRTELYERLCRTSDLAHLSEHPAVREAVVLAREDVPGDKRIVAYVVPDLHSLQAIHSQNAISASNDRWQDVYDRLYQQSANEGDEAFNLAGWNSSYTREPFAVAEMQEQVSATVNRVLALRPRRILEVGCGTGLLLFRLASDCQSYVGTDFSAEAIQRLRRQVSRRGLDHVEVQKRLGNDFDGFEPHSFDTVVLNSVVQYFPSLDYLFDVLDRSLDVVSPGGVIMLGDIRNFALLRAYHLSVQSYRGADSLPVSELTDRIRLGVQNEQELLLHPLFFRELKDLDSRIGDVAIQLRRGRVRNELTRFRYDVFLRVGAVEPAAEEVCMDWVGQGFSLENVRNYLLQAGPPALRLENVPNARLAQEMALQSLLGSSRERSLGELRKTLAGICKTDGVDPEDLWALGDTLGYETQVSWSDRGGADGKLTVLFRQAGVKLLEVPDSGKRPSDRMIFAHRANNPLRNKLTGVLISQLRENAKSTLPEHMIPSTFVDVDHLPLSPNGKVDRRALPAPDESRYRRREYEAPQGDAEEMLARIWADVLKIERVGRHDNFFDLGGHSLAAVTLLERMRQQNLSIDVRTLFSTPTIVELAASLKDVEIVL